MVLLVKGHPDANLHKHLENLEKHPALLERCRMLYLERVINRSTYEEIRKKHGLALSTIHAYTSAYRKVLQKYSTEEGADDILVFLDAEIRRLMAKRAGVVVGEDGKPVGREEVSRQDYSMLTREIRSYQGMYNELKGFVDRRPQVNVNVLVGQLVTVIAEEVPKALREFMGQTLTEEVIGKVVALAGERIEGKSNDSCSQWQHVKGCV